MRNAVAFALLALSVAACGLKGPLYLPSDQEAHEAAERKRLLDERRARERAEQQQVKQSKDQPSATPAPEQK